MGFKFNPFSGNFDQTGSGGGGASYIDGEVQNFSALPQTVGSPAVDSAYLVREAEGTWLLNRKPAGIYIRTANTGTRASDWTYAGEFPDVFNDANFVLYDDADSTKNAKFQLSSIATGTTRTISVPNKNITLDDSGDSRTPTAHAASHAAGVKASYNGQVAGMTEDVFIRANTAGTAGNSITLSFSGGTKGTFTGQVSGMTTNVTIRALNNGSNGNVTLYFDGVITIQDAIDSEGSAELVSGNGAQVPNNGGQIVLTGGGGTIADVLSSWNSANPSNQATLISGDGEQAPNNATSITLSGGIAGGSDPITNARFESLRINGSEVEFGGSLNPYNLPFKVRSQDASNIQIAQVLGFNGKGAAFYGTGGLSTDGPIVQATEYEVTNNVNFYVNAYGGNVSVGKTTNGAKLDVGGKIRLADTSDGTKQVELSAASVGAGQVRVVTFPDKNITLDDAGDARTPSSHTHELTALAATGATNGHVLTANGSNGATFAALPASGGTKTYAVFTATDNQPPATNFMTLDTRNGIAVLDADDATDESAVFVSIIPEGASLGSGLKIRLHWMATTATSGNVVWDVSLERMTTDLDSDSFDTIASGTAAANGTSGILAVTEITLTTIDSVTAGDGYRLKVTRDANNASDTMTGDAELVAVEVRSAA